MSRFAFLSPLLNWFTWNRSNLLFLLACVVALIPNLIPLPTSMQTMEMMGTFIQIALPCYALVPILSKKDAQGAKQMLSLLFAVLALTYLLKFTLPFKRPYGGSHSFPSGHTAGAFIGAVFLGFRYGRTYALVAFPLAAYVGVSRVLSRNHWPTDVAASIIICFGFGYFLIKKHESLRD